MSDGLWHTQGMEEGANQGCPLLTSLAALVLGKVLRPLNVALTARTRRQFLNTMVDTQDNGVGGETHPMGYIDDVGAATPLANVIFFFEDFNRLG